MRDAHLDEYLKIYYTNLANCVIMAPLMIPVILANSSEIQNIENIAESKLNETAHSALLFKLTESKEKQYVLRMKEVLADACRYGWL